MKTILISSLLVLVLTVSLVCGWTVTEKDRQDCADAGKRISAEVAPKENVPFFIHKCTIVKNGREGDGHWTLDMVVYRTIPTFCTNTIYKNNDFLGPTFHLNCVPLKDWKGKAEDNHADQTKYECFSHPDFPGNWCA